MSKKSNVATEITEAVTATVEPITPAVDVQLTIDAAALVTTGTVALVNALRAKLKVTIASLAAVESERGKVAVELAEASGKVDELEFLKLIAKAVMTISNHFGLEPDDDRLKVDSRVVSYTLTSGRTLAADVKFRAGDAQDSASIHIARKYPATDLIVGLETKIANLESQIAAIKAEAQELRVQIADRDGLRDQVSAGLTRAMLGHTEGVGRSMLSALLEGVEDASNPILALLAPKPAK